MPRIELERREESRDFAERSDEDFDRMTFAERAVALVRPPKTTVAICMGARRVSLEAGRRWGEGPEARWAVLSFPPDASRQAIARAILDLPMGLGRPWALDILLSKLELERIPA